VLGCHVTVTATAPVGLPLGLTLPAPEHLSIDPQVASGFRDPVAMFRHQTDRFLFELLCILPSLFCHAGHLLK
jgi:hypothetical protein